MALSPPKKTTKKKTTKKKTTKKKVAKKPKQVLTGVAGWVAKMNKERRFVGSTQIKMASEIRTPYNLRRPFNVTGLDIALGGGLHAGGIVEVQGEESVGKTYLAYSAAAQIQQNYGKDAGILLACTELRPDKGFARMAGMCVAYSPEEIEELEDKRVAAGREPFTKDEVADLRTQVGSVAVVMAETAEKLFDVLLDAIEEGCFQMIIIDSLGALLTKAADEGEVGDRHFGGPAMAITNFQNKLFPLLNLERPDGELCEVTIFGINQARANIGHSRFERSTKSAMGAHSWKHGMLVSILLEKGAALREGDTVKGPPIGRTVRWLLTKGKAGTHDGKKGSYNFYYPPKEDPVFWKDVQEYYLGGIDIYTELAETAKSLKIVKVEGSWMHWNGQKWQGLSNFADHLAQPENKEELVKLRAACMEKANVFVRNK